MELPQQDRPSRASEQPRKGSLTGGGKSWTDEEEVYLLQMRLQKIPYKKIAAKLDKTELACRLHYHQLSHGGARRRGSMAQASFDAGGSAPSPAGSTSSEVSIQAEFSSSGGQSTSRREPGQSERPIILGRQRSQSDTTGATRSSGLTALSLDKSTLPGLGAIDLAKLTEIVEERKPSFWQQIAKEYGGQVDPSELEGAWESSRHDGSKEWASAPRLPPLLQDSFEGHSLSEKSPKSSREAKSWNHPQDSKLSLARLHSREPGSDIVMGDAPAPT